MWFCMRGSQTCLIKWCLKWLVICIFLWNKRYFAKNISSSFCHALAYLPKNRNQIGQGLFKYFSILFFIHHWRQLNAAFWRSCGGGWGVNSSNTTPFQTFFRTFWMFLYFEPQKSVLNCAKCIVVFLVYACFRF